MSAVAGVLDHPLMYVTGQGGAGKSTVAAALGVASAPRGRHTLLCELAEAQCFVSAAPCAKEIVVMGKLTELSDPARAGGRRYDAVVADGPATGHALAMLAAPSTIATVARIGPAGADARAVRDAIADPLRTTSVVVSLPEELSVRETVGLERGLEQTQAPILALPFVFAAAIGRPQLEDLAGDLLSGLPALGRGGIRMRHPAGSATTTA